MTSVFALLLITVLLGKLFTIICGFYAYKDLSIPFRITLLLTIIATFAEIGGFYISHFLGSKNSWLFNIYLLIEVWLMGFVAILLIKNKRIKIIFSIFILIHLFYWILNTRLSSIFVFGSNSMILGCIILVFFYIVVLFSNSLFAAGGLFVQPIFWLCLSNILYFGCDIPVMGLYNFLTEKMPQLGGKLAYINTYLDIIRYPLYGVSFLLLGRAKQSKLVTA